MNFEQFCENFLTIKGSEYNFRGQKSLRAGKQEIFLKYYWSLNKIYLW